MKNYKIVTTYLVDYSDNGVAIGTETEAQNFTAYTRRGAVAKAKRKALRNIKHFYKPLGVVVIDFTTCPVG